MAVSNNLRFHSLFRTKKAAIKNSAITTKGLATIPSVFERMKNMSWNYIRLGIGLEIFSSPSMIFLNISK